MWKALLFNSIWMGITIPILLSVVFTILHPLLVFEYSGVLMIVVTLIIGIIDVYLAIRIWTWIEGKFFERKLYM
ncbi:hypothetical protein BW42_01135 [Exiguobacterium sp. RIT341]|nr:hypothetical protein BW42_01135 [Exiguobacterium sp. RIT341]